MKKEEFEFLSSDKKTMIHATKWVPDGEIKGVLQICHGMIEYIGRYDEFATFMAENGYYVVGNDHLGHGDSVLRADDHGFFGHPRGNINVIKDIHYLRIMTEVDLLMQKKKDVPYFMLGHSMGSFLLRQYLTVRGKGLSGAIIMGTGYQPAVVLKAGKAVCRVMSIVKGWKVRSRIVNIMAFGRYNRRIKSVRTIQDWLTRNEAVVDAYMHDPLCSYMFTINGFYQMFTGMQVAHNKKRIAKTPKNLPLFLVAGAEDPVGNYGEGVKKVYGNYLKAGIKDVKIKLYKDDRHELLNELDKETVYADLLEWIGKHVKTENSVK